MVSIPVKPGTRDAFLLEYAKVLRDELNSYTEGVAVHRAHILAADISQVVVEILPEGERYEELRCTRQAEDWSPRRNAFIEFRPPNKITVTRHSDFFDNMLYWSNVQAYLDAEFIIEHLFASLIEQKKMRHNSPTLSP